jgi:hypothetical protein
MTITYTATHTPAAEYYTSFSQITSSNEELIDNLDTGIEYGNKFVSQSFIEFDNLAHRFKLIHYALSLTETDQLIVHYNTFRESVFSTYIKSVQAYVLCAYVGPPKITHLNATLRKVEIELLEITGINHWSP